MDKVELAEWLHDNYEELAKANDWQTQEITRVKFDDLPRANKDTMLALADRLHNTFLIIARQALVSGQLPLPTEADASAYANGAFGYEEYAYDRERGFMSGYQWTVDWINSKADGNDH